jgi:hypothetical protein
MTIDELEQAHLAATPAPWATAPTNATGVTAIVPSASPSSRVSMIARVHYKTTFTAEGEGVANADLIAASRNAVPDFIAALRLLAHNDLDYELTEGEAEERRALLAKWGVS